MLSKQKLANFVYWIKEREAIRIAKERGDPQPWTEDQFLQAYRFCNVRRRDDRVSRWLLENLYIDHDHPLLWLQACVARWINWPPTLQEIEDMWNYDTLKPAWFAEVGNIIDARVDRGEKAWTGAYMIHSLQSPMGKGLWLLTKAIQPLYDDKAKFEEFFKREDRTVEQAMKLFDGAFNHGSFMAGQIVADWTYTPLLQSASDLYTWAPVGPGSSRGMNKLHERPKDRLMKQDQFTDELQELMTSMFDAAEFIPSLTAHDIQNCLCEWDKYTRLESGGQVRARYTPEERF